MLKLTPIFYNFYCFHHLPQKLHSVNYSIKCQILSKGLNNDKYAQKYTNVVLMS